MNSQATTARGSVHTVKFQNEHFHLMHAVWYEMEMKSMRAYSGIVLLIGPTDADNPGKLVSQPIVAR